MMRHLIAIVVRVISVLIVSTAFAVRAAGPPAPDRVMSAVGIENPDVERLLNGEIVPYSATEPTDKTLSTGVAMYVKAAPGRLVDAIRRGALTARDPDVLASGDIAQGPGVESFRRLAFASGWRDEAENLLTVEAGSEFNLSAQEIARIQALARSLDGRSADAAVRAVTREYQSILLQRVQAYRRYGLSGIAPYDRGGGRVSDAGAELRIFTLNNGLLELFAPALREALLRYPAPLPAKTASHLHWLNRKVQGRPTAILTHRLIHTFDDAAVIVQNEFYAGHSFNAGQMVIGSMPYRGGTLLVYTHRSSSDQVTGIGQGLKHAIGREALLDEMIKRFQRLKSSLK